MGYAAILVAIVGVGLIAAREHRRPIRIAVLLILVALPAVGLCASLLLGNERARARIDVQFLGLRLPLSEMNDCLAPADVTKRAGVWFGGGAGSPVLDADLFLLSGYRPRLIELCRDQRTGPLSVRLRVVLAGRDFQTADTVAGVRSTRPADGLITQRAVIRALHESLKDHDCLWTGSQSLSASDIERAIVPRWLSQRATGVTGWRSYLKTVVARSPATTAANVFCIDVRGTQAPCADDYAATGRATFFGSLHDPDAWRRRSFLGTRILKPARHGCRAVWRPALAQIALP